jgi:hypothetical protein
MNISLLRWAALALRSSGSRRRISFTVVGRRESGLVLAAGVVLAVLSLRGMCHSSCLTRLLPAHRG